MGWVHVMIADEAHRIRETSNNRLTPGVEESKLSQTQELLKASRTSVFFLNDNQIVRPVECSPVLFLDHIDVLVEVTIVGTARRGIPADPNADRVQPGGQANRLGFTCWTFRARRAAFRAGESPHSVPRSAGAAFVPR